MGLSRKVFALLLCTKTWIRSHTVRAFVFYQQFVDFSQNASHHGGRTDIGIPSWTHRSSLHLAVTRIFTWRRFSCFHFLNYDLHHAASHVFTFLFFCITDLTIGGGSLESDLQLRCIENCELIPDRWFAHRARAPYATHMQ